MKVGVVGVGSFASRVILPGLRLSDACDLVAVCDRDEGAVRRVASTFEVPQVYTGIDQLMADASGLGLDLVVVAAPPAAHQDIVSTVLDHGLHVLCEKPLTLSSVGAQVMAAKANGLGRINAVDHELRYSSAYRTLRSLVTSGYVGKVRQVNLSIAADYSVNPMYAATYFWNFGSLLESGGGIIAQMLSHFIDLYIYIFGDIEPVGGYATTLIPEKPLPLPAIEPGGVQQPGPLRAVDAEDAVALIGVLPGSAPATINANWVTPGSSGTRWEIRGSEGSLIYQATDPLYGGEIMGWRVDAPEWRVLPLEAEYRADRPMGTPGYGSALIAHTVAELAAAIQGGQGERRYATFASEVEVWRRMDQWRDLIKRTDNRSATA